MIFKELKKVMNDNFEFPSSEKKDKPRIAYSEIKVRALITAIEKRLDKNQKDY
jgi:hypothetical protein